MIQQESEIIIKIDPKDLVDMNIGQIVELRSINRTTGECKVVIPIDWHKDNWCIQFKIKQSINGL